jgi:hypothetical protein
LWSLSEMERTGGEPDVVWYDEKTDKYVFFDCSAETPKGRVSLCYDREALDSRKDFKPENDAFSLANEMWIDILSEEQYKYLQTLGVFDIKTSSWLKTPIDVRKLWWAIFWDRRYDRVFVYHNWAESYYKVRWFRGVVEV